MTDDQDELIMSCGDSVSNNVSVKLLCFLCVSLLLMFSLVAILCTFYSVWEKHWSNGKMADVVIYMHTIH